MFSFILLIIFIWHYIYSKPEIAENFSHFIPIIHAFPYYYHWGILILLNHKKSNLLFVG